MKANRIKISLGMGLLYFLLFITLLLMIGTCIEKSPESSSKSTKNNQPEKLYIGDNAKFSDTEWVVLEAKIIGERLVSNNFLADDKITEGNFIGLSFKVKNVSKKEIDFNLFNDKQQPKLYDSEDREFRYIDSMSLYVPVDANTTNPFMYETKIQPGLSQVFHAIFEVPKDASSLALEIYPVTNRTEKALRIYLGF